MLEILRKENEVLKQKLNKIGKKNLLEKMELELEIEALKRKKNLLNLLMPKIDMEDISSCLTSFLFRMFPYNRAMIIYSGEEGEFLHVTESQDQRYLEHKGGEGKEEKEFAKYLAEKIKEKRESIYINGATKGQDKCLTYMKGKTCIAVPIFCMEKTICICYLESNKDGSYSEREVLELETVMKTSAYAFLNSARYVKICDVSFRDKLTGLYNKKYMKKVIENQVVISESGAEPFSLIKLKITGCKNSKDSCFDEKRDDFFKEIIKVLKRRIRAVDMVFSVEEYTLVFLINDSNNAIAEIITARLINYINENRIVGLFLLNEINKYTYTPGKCETVAEILKKLDST